MSNYRLYNIVFKDKIFKSNFNIIIDYEYK